MTDNRVIVLPLSTNRAAQLQAPFPITDEEWERLMAVLAAMRPGLVFTHDR